MDISTGFALKSEDFQLAYYFSNSFFQKLIRTLSLISGLLAFTVHVFIAHVCVLTWCTHDINQHARARAVPTMPALLV